MFRVKEIISSDNAERSSIIIGGGSVKLNAWPTNPDGESLVLVSTIECANLKKISGFSSIPKEGVLYIFSTYSRSDYFLDNVTYSGDTSELKLILSGYTLVTIGNSDSEIVSPNESIPKAHTEFKEREIGHDEYPVFSMLTNTPPNGIVLPLGLQKEYEFVMQLYSSDFPEPFKDIFYLTDAVGCLLLKKDGSGGGLFFVHTA